ncbi:MAG: efflux RND transporter periplasmic adaptor subunit [Pirellulaceae bacterium]
MIEKPTAAEQAQVEAVKQRIRQILAELKQLAKSEVSDQEFLGQLVARTLESTGAAGATIWQVDEDGHASVVHEAGTTASKVNLDDDQREMHNKLVRTVVASGRPTLIEPQARDQGSGEVLNPMAFLLLLKPLNDPALHRHYAIELFQRPDIAAAARTGYMRYLEEIGEIFATWQARNQLRFQTSRQSEQQRLLGFVRDIHSSLDPREVAYAAANDGRLLAECDRLSVLSFDGRTAKVLSVSGQDDFDNRSNVVRKQQDLAAAVCRSRQPLWLTGESEGLPRVIKHLVDDYLNDSHARTLGVIPLIQGDEEQDQDPDVRETEPPEVNGALVFEWFGQDVSEQEAAGHVEVLSDHVGRALANADTYRSIFLMPVWRTIGKWRWLIKARTLPKTIAVAVGLLLLTLFFTLFPWSLQMRVQGVLQPVEQQNVFANMQGVIEHVYVEHNQQVKKGEKLLDLRNDELEYQLTTAERQLTEIVQRIRTTMALLPLLPDDQEDATAAKLADLNEQLVTINQQINELEKMKSKLEIRAPIDGTIVSWDPQRDLIERPVERQDVVLVIAAVNSDWQMELFIPERKYGHVLGGGKDPGVTFFSATDPNRSYQGQITRLESHAAEHPPYGSSVRAFASFEDPQGALDLYVGAAVTAKIDCGTSSVGYAWFHELFEFVQSRLLF